MALLALTVPTTRASLVMPSLALLPVSLARAALIRVVEVRVKSRVALMLLPAPSVA